MATLEYAPLLEEFLRTRARTLELVGTLEADDYAVQTARYSSPPKWHVGHVSWIFEVVLERIGGGYERYSEEMSGYLNSYYQQFGRPRDKGSRGSVSRPTTAEILRYYDSVTESVRARLLRGVSPGEAALVETACHHESQHQELLVYDLQHMLAGAYRPARRLPPEAGEEAAAGTARIPGGIYEMGNAGGGFCYDIELPEHKVYTEDYEIDTRPVTNGEFARFIEDGGYGTYKHWLADGWERVREEGWEAPMYWTRRDGAWHVSDFAGEHEVDPDMPVCHVSYYEADAYARWAGKRLPTEAEWEKAACWDPERGKLAFPWGDAPPGQGTCNLLESYHWGPARSGSYPAGQSPSGCRQMIGDVWEWTASEFTGYPGFRSGFDEYNDKWFTGQKVLRGGSFATPRASIRTSYRNFFRLDERWMFAGFRCARDA
ncbi:MAG: ergothioneine biosynthesis protein EgtB [Nitrosopumilus sp.]|nr:ergothioneine biosynthesis protein EgtB [Nitrosopumilus sp.]CAI9831480.1 conserved hypothetical protein [Nitrosopumilaceae archaeon]MDA7940764.1 ergothioneine biosynthesis protein EgtB [Nitrosopumilus sp.]MDA7942972.1 ergothioneine biosynthesis protein EgtB [Nitrosopumilus sp.]MDA7944617.1 ergothioneine biosynthesis protein EgtB [Nitrosopumilus sp.]